MKKPYCIPKLQGSDVLKKPVISNEVQKLLDKVSDERSISDNMELNLKGTDKEDKEAEKDKNC